MPKHIALAYIDILTCLFAAFFAFFVFMNDDVAKAKANVQDISQFLFTITWPKESKDDIDIFVRDPLGNIVSFKTKQVDGANLDQDDIATKEIDVDHREIITINKQMTGRYTINSIAYAKRDRQAVRVKGQVLKLQPFATLCEREMEFIQTGQEETICSFTIDQNGIVLSKENNQESVIK